MEKTFSAQAPVEVSALLVYLHYISENDFCQESDNLSERKYF